MEIHDLNLLEASSLVKCIFSSTVTLYSALRFQTIIFHLTWFQGWFHSQEYLWKKKKSSFINWLKVPPSLSHTHICTNAHTCQLNPEPCLKSGWENETFLLYSSPMWQPSWSPEGCHGYCANSWCHLSFVIVRPFQLTNPGESSLKCEDIPGATGMAICKDGGSGGGAVRKRRVRVQ